jgi:LemA protein
MSPALWIVLGLVLVVIVYAIWLYNRLVRLRTRTDDGWATIDVQLRRRYDLIPNLVQTVQGYAAHERELFERVTEARTRALAASDVADHVTAENAVTDGLGKLMAVVEAYPELKADEHFLALQEELVGTESKIAYARQFYNDQVRRLNTAIDTFPSTLVARAFGYEERAFFDIDDPVTQPVQIELGRND